MKNFEKYIDSIEQIIVKNHGCNGLYEEIYSKECGVWDFVERKVRQEYCKKCVMYGLKEWLLEKYKEPIHLTHDEYVILKNVPKGSELIERDRDGDLYLKGRFSECVTMNFFNAFKHLFTFIKINEEYEIAKLIADYEKENGDA